MKEKNQKKRTVGFRRWTRKSYAAFNSLKLVIKICVLSATYSLIKPSQQAQAQADTSKISKTTKIEEVEISGQREPVVASQISRIVTVISKPEIEQAPAINVNDLLRQVPQTDIRERGPNGAQADISIQGGSFDETLILLNGINLTDPQTGHYNLTLPFDLESVDRIEVLKGGASRVYGANAFSGAVNFITGQDTINHIKAGLTTGDFGLYRGAYTANVHSSHFTDFISVSKGHSNGYIHNTGYDYTNAYYLGKAIFNKYSNLTLQLGYADNAYGANNFYSPWSADQFDHTDTYFASLSGETGNIIKIKPYLYWRRNYDHYVFIKDNPTYYQNFHFTDVYGGGLNATYPEAFGKTSLGVDYRNETIHSTSLGFITPDSIQVEDQNLYYDKMDSRENISAFLEQVLTLDKFSASLGVMANHNSKIGGVDFYPGGDLAYTLNSTIKLYATVNHSLRLPTFTDLFYLGPQVKGDPTLQPEQAWSFESGVKFGNRVVNGNISYFHRWGRDIIDYVMNSNGVWQAIEYPKLNTDGLEIAAGIQPRQVYGKDFFIERILLSYSFTTLSKNSDTITSNYALDNLRHKFTLGIYHRIYKNLGASWQLSLQKRNGNYGKFDPATDIITSMPYNAFFLVDGKIFYQCKLLEIYAEATNLFNQKYIDFGNIAQPGRWFKAGIDLNFGWK